MTWFKRKPKPKFLPEHMLYPTDRIDRIKPKEESRVSEKTTKPTEEKPFDPYEYGGSFIHWLASPEEIEQLRRTKSQQEYDELMGKIKYLREIKREEEHKRETALAAEKAKTHWAQVTFYDNPIPIEAHAEKLDAYIVDLNKSFAANDHTMVPLHLFKEGVRLVRLKDISSIHFTEAYMKVRNEPYGTDQPDTN